MKIAKGTPGELSFDRLIPETLVVSTAAYDHFLELMKSSVGPTPANRRGAELLRRLYAQPTPSKEDNGNG